MDRKELDDFISKIHLEIDTCFSSEVIEKLEHMHQLMEALTKGTQMVLGMYGGLLEMVLRALAGIVLSEVSPSLRDLALYLITRNYLTLKADHTVQRTQQGIELQTLLDEVTKATVDK